MRSHTVAMAISAAILTLGTSAWALAEPSPSPSGQATPSPFPSGQATPSPSPSGQATAMGQPTRIAELGFTAADFEGYRPDAEAITYRPDLVPVGSSATVLSTSKPGGHTTVLLTVYGLRPSRKYGAHVHVNRCGPKGEDAGPHYQNVPDPVQPSVNPAYANPRNEIWLDFTTDKNGNATSTSTVGWRFTDDRRPHSVVLHSEHTHTNPGHAGVAGARLACVNVDF